MSDAEDTKGRRAPDTLGALERASFECSGPSAEEPGEDYGCGDRDWPDLEEQALLARIADWADYVNTFPGGQRVEYVIDCSTKHMEPAACTLLECLAQTLNRAVEILRESGPEPVQPKEPTRLSPRYR